VLYWRNQTAQQAQEDKDSWPLQQQNPKDSLNWRNGQDREAGLGLKPYFQNIKAGLSEVLAKPESKWQLDRKNLEPGRTLWITVDRPQP